MKNPFRYIVSVYPVKRGERVCWQVERRTVMGAFFQDWYLYGLATAWYNLCELMK